MATITTASPFIDASVEPGRRHTAAQEVKWFRIGTDMTSSDTIVETGKRLRAACDGIRRLIVDATHLNELDTKFIALLVDLYRWARSLRITIEILPSAAVRKWLTICRLEALTS